MPRRLIGVDFSGARAAGDHIWVAIGTATDDGFLLESVRPARDLPGGARAREPALRALVAFLSSEPDTTAGLDFPFSLPRSLIEELSWEEFLRAFPSRYRDADAFRTACRSTTNGREIKRDTDRDSKVPFCVYNLRLYRQTYAGLVDVLLPLVDSGAARVVPMQAPAPGTIRIAEICPASFLKPRGLYVPYKGSSGPLREARSALIDTMVNNGLLIKPEKSLSEILVADRGGDAIDAMLAAMGAALVPDAAPAATDPIERIEGRVYF